MGKVICFIGMDGAGKSTLVKKIAQKLAEAKPGLVTTYYFGWKPFLPSTKLLSRFFKKKKYKITDHMNKKEKRFSIVQELLLFYYYIEYLARYSFIILPLKFKKNYVILDRNIYDLYAHYDYGKNSVLLPFLFKLFPRPHLIFFLNVDPKIAHERKPEMNIELLKKHHKRYDKLCKSQNIIPIDTYKNNVESCVQKIMGYITK